MDEENTIVEKKSEGERERESESGSGDDALSISCIKK